MGPVTWGGRPYFSWKKTGNFFSHHRPCVSCQFCGHHCGYYSFHSFTRVSPIISGMQKNCRSSCGTPFHGAPVRSNMLNMPKSAAEFDQQQPMNHISLIDMPRILIKIENGAQLLHRDRNHRRSQDFVWGVHLHFFFFLPKKLTTFF